MSDSRNGNTHQHSDSNENETQRLHRLVLPMILDLLRSRGEQRNNRSSESRPTNEHIVNNPLTESLSRSQDDAHLDDAHLDNAHLDDAHLDDAHLDDAHLEDSHTDGTHDVDMMDDNSPPPLSFHSGNDSDTQDRDQHMQDEHEAETTLPAPSTSSPSSRRPRYRLVVYFEERELSADESTTDSYDGDQPMDTTSSRPSRYVAVFSVDSDDHNMPIIHSAGLQNTPANFEDILNQLFTSYVPKGTPPAKQDFVDSLPISTYSASFASQPKCAVCLEDFEDGTEMAELPCSHRFHGDSCVKPWLKIHNSCPVCRYELPVDDTEYEQNRKARMAGRTIHDSPSDIGLGANPGPSAM